MKKISIIISSFCVMFTFAQKVSDYKYVVVKTNIESFKKQDFGLSNFLTQKLKAKKYIVIPESRGQWPDDANANPCNVLNAEILNDSGFLRNKVILEFKDCNAKVIASEKASSSIKEYEEGFKDALSRALITVPNSLPKNLENTTIVQPKQTITESVNSNNLANNEESTSSKALRYSNGNTTLQKIEIDANQFILVDNNSSAPFATFKETTKKGVYRVKLQSGEFTTGYFENNNLVIEIPTSNDDYKKEIFSPLK